MIQRVGAPPAYGIPDPGPTPGVLQAQLTKVEGQLRDCVNCDSARTPEGKAKIQALTNQAQSIRAKLEAAQRVRPSEQAQPKEAAPSATPSPGVEGRLDLLA